MLQLLFRKEDRTSLSALIGGILGGLALIIIILLLLIILCKCFNVKVNTTIIILKLLISTFIYLYMSIQASNKNFVPSAVAYHAHDVSVYQ